MAQEKHSNIRKYHKPLNVNIGMIIFGAMFIYIIICIIMYMQTEHLSGYEVKTGSLTVNNVYRGIALREETLYESIDAGYVYPSFVMFLSLLYKEISLSTSQNKTT